jgi:hypothetical protein
MSRSPANVCPFCRMPHALEPHCSGSRPGACVWLRCTCCKVTYDPRHQRAVALDGTPIELPRAG